jgi:tripartite-type tricarboxylate transporter receptor subunit TctC
MKLIAVSATVAALAASLIAAPVAAQPTPLPAQIKIIVPFAAGASTDAAARAVASELGKRTGSSVIVENQPGASTFIGAGAAVKAAKDGSVLLMTSTSTVTAQATKKIVPVDITTELVPVAQLTEGPLIVAASAENNIKTPADLVAAARAKPDEITHGTGGIGTLAHVAAEMINDAAKIQLKHIPYKGASLAVNDFVAGRIDLMIGVYTTVAPQVKAGRVRLVGVTTAQPHPAFPGVPTMASAVPGLSIDIWVGFFAPLGTPPAVVQRLNAELNEVAKSKAVLDVVSLDGSTPVALTPEQFGARVKSSYAGWKKLAADKNIYVE